MMILEKIIAWLAPYECIGCGTEGDMVCPWCLPDAAESLPERCFRCHALSKDSAVCSACRKSVPLRYVWVRTQYDGMAKILVHRLKFERASAGARLIAQLLSESLPYLPRETMVVAVPTATSRVRLRGYDHAELIAKHLASQQGLRHARLLVRMGQTRQVGASRQARQQQLANAFRIATGDIRGAKVLLVDDVVTTGATLEAAARCLRRAGARSVDAVVFAQKQ